MDEEFVAAWEQAARDLGAGPFTPGGRRPFEFACPKCGGQLAAYMTDVNYQWQDQLKINATFESDHVCPGRPRG